jgi:hypothetical protein
MNLTPAELASVRAQGLFLTEKCDGCGKVLNQTFRYAVTGGIFCLIPARFSQIELRGARGNRASRVTLNLNSSMPGGLCRIPVDATSVGHDRTRAGRTYS